MIHHVSSFHVEYLCRYQPIWRPVADDAQRVVVTNNKAEAIDLAHEVRRTGDRPVRVVDDGGAVILQIQ